MKLMFQSRSGVRCEGFGITILHNVRNSYLDLLGHVNKPMDIENKLNSQSINTTADIGPQHHSQGRETSVLGPRLWVI